MVDIKQIIKDIEHIIRVNNCDGIDGLTVSEDIFKVLIGKGSPCVGIHIGEQSPGFAFFKGVIVNEWPFDDSTYYVGSSETFYSRVKGLQELIKRQLSLIE